MNLLVKVFVIWLISIKTQIFHCLTICWPAFDKICQLEPCSPFLGLSSLDTSLPFHLPHCRKDSSSFWNFCAMGNRKFSIVELLLPLFLFSLSFLFFYFLVWLLHGFMRVHCFQIHCCFASGQRVFIDFIK